MFADPTTISRFWSKVDTSAGPDACWPWLAGRFAGREYGVFRTDYKNYRAHRFAYELTNGPIPASLLIRHTCDHGWCCNPAHLLAGTDAENKRDMVERGRSHKGEQVALAKLNPAKVRAIRTLYDGGWSQQAIADMFGVHQTAVSSVIQGRTWKHVV